MAPDTPTATENRRQGIAKMESEMTPAARVRRAFQLGRPRKPEQLPLHPAVVWERAKEALGDFRSRMVAVELDPKDATAFIIYIELATPTIPRWLHMEREGVSREDARAEVYAKLAGVGAMALGMVFLQTDTAAKAKQLATFPYLFTGLSETGVALLKLACKIHFDGVEASRNSN